VKEIRRILGLDRKEEREETGPSSFVLFFKGEEKRLDLGDKLRLNPSTEIFVFKDFLSITLTKEGLSFVKFDWGMIRKQFGHDEKIFGTTLKESSIAHFNEDRTSLISDDWELHYRPV
jgi:hypothetical protein